MPLKKTFLKNRKTISLSLLVLLIELIGFTYLAYPPSPLYSLRNNTQSLIISLIPVHKFKAKFALSESSRLQKHLSMIQKQNPKDPNIVAIAQELISQEQQAIEQMDLAKKSGTNISGQVEQLCNTLIKQYPLLKESLSQMNYLVLQQSTDITKTNLDESAGW